MLSRPLVLGAVTASLVAMALAGCSGPTLSGGDAATPDTTASATAKPRPTSASPSTAPTPEQPSPDPSGSGTSAGPEITKLAKGEKPPQFVVVSFDGACSDNLWKHYLKLAEDTGSHFTFFFSGLCLVPKTKRNLYRPPGKPVGTSAIAFAQPKLVPDRIRNLTTAYERGHEIGTHFNGHFCDAQGVGTWTTAQWNSELAQARSFLDDWAVNNGSTDPSLKLPFTSKIWKGARTPCLMGKPSQMFPAFQKAGFTYDASRTGRLTWPKKVAGFTTMWEFPLQRINIVGYNKTNLSMDYNLLYVQNGGKTEAAPAKCKAIESSTYQSYAQALKAVHNGNRAPLFIGNHFNEWACGAYVDALTRFVTDASRTYDDVQFVTFEWLARWMNAQDPKVLKALQAKPAPSY